MVPKSSRYFGGMYENQTCNMKQGLDAMQIAISSPELQNSGVKLAKRLC